MGDNRLWMISDLTIAAAPHPSVPEPATVWLLLSGLGGLGMFGRKRLGRLIASK